MKGWQEVDDANTTLEGIRATLRCLALGYQENESIVDDLGESLMYLSNELGGIHARLHKVVDEESKGTGEEA